MFHMERSSRNPLIITIIIIVIIIIIDVRRVIPDNSAAQISISGVQVRESHSLLEFEGSCLRSFVELVIVGFPEMVFHQLVVSVTK